MLKTLTATVLSATLALGTIAPTQAQAGDADAVARFLFGAAALAIIANELNNNNQAHARPSVQGRIVHRDNSVITPHRQNRARAVPRSCQRTLQTSAGNTRNVFGVPCLQRQGVAVARLPRTCLRTIELPRRTIDGFGKRCLLRNGVNVIN